MVSTRLVPYDARATPDASVVGYWAQAVNSSGQAGIPWLGPKVGIDDPYDGKVFAQAAHLRRSAGTTISPGQHVNLGVVLKAEHPGTTLWTGMSITYRANGHTQTVYNPIAVEVVVDSTCRTIPLKMLMANG